MDKKEAYGIKSSAAGRFVPSPAEGAARLRKVLTGCMIVFLMLCVFIYAGADEAKEIKTGITFSGNGKSEDFPLRQDDNFKTY